MEAQPAENSRAQRLLRDAQARWHIREGDYDPIWDGLNAVIMPRKAEILAPDHTPDLDKERALYDGTIARANQVAAAGQMSWMSPVDSPWFSVDPARNQRHSDPVKRWLAECTDIYREHLAASGTAYHSFHESYLNAGCTGTYALTTESDGLGSLLFRGHDTGTYSIAENHRLEVDVVDHRYVYTPHQILSRYNLPTDNIPESIRAKIAVGGDAATQKLKVWHLVFPRPDAPQVPGAMSAELPVASVHILEDGHHILRESGYQEMPTAVGQWLRWGDSPYGWSPGWLCYPEARQLNTLQKYADILAETAAYPRILAPSDMSPGDFDFRAYGISYFDASKPTDAQPRPWLTEGRNGELRQRIEDKREEIKNGYMTDMFQLFTGIDKQITAYEAAQLQAERLVQFSPTFALRTTQLFRPVLKRGFWLLYRQGAFPQPPDEAYVDIGDGTALLPDPHIEFSSRMTMAMKSLKNLSLQRVLQTLQPLADANPAVLDNFDFDRIARDSSLNDGLPAPWIRDEAQREQMRQERAQLLASQTAPAPGAQADTAPLPA